MNLFKWFKSNKETTDNYFDSIIKESKENLYSFEKKINQETKLLKIYGNSNIYNKKNKNVCYK